MDKKLTDNEIIKALEDEIHLAEYVDSGFCNGVSLSLVKSTLDLINRQKAEIERLKAKCENTQIGYNFSKDEIKKLKKDKYKLQKALNQSEDFRVLAKAEAYKEFAERLKKETFKINYCGSMYNVVDVDEIDNFLKEMVGEDNG